MKMTTLEKITIKMDMEGLSKLTGFLDKFRDEERKEIATVKMKTISVDRGQSGICFDYKVKITPRGGVHESLLLMDFIQNTYFHADDYKI